MEEAGSWFSSSSSFVKRLAACRIAVRLGEGGLEEMEAVATPLRSPVAVLSL